MIKPTLSRYLSGAMQIHLSFLTVRTYAYERACVCKEEKECERERAREVERERKRERE